MPTRTASEDDEVALRWPEDVAGTEVTQNDVPAVLIAHDYMHSIQCSFNKLLIAG